MTEPIPLANTFSGECDGYRLSLIKISSSTLQVNLVDIRSLEQYCETIDSYMKIDSNTRIDLIQYISTHFSQLLIQNGTIKFRYQFGEMKGPRVFTIRPVKKQKLSGELQKEIKDYFTNEIKFKDEKIKELSTLIRKLQAKNQELKEYMKPQKEYEDVVRRLEEQIQKNQQLTKQMQGLHLKIKALTQNVAQMTIRQLDQYLPQKIQKIEPIQNEASQVSQASQFVQIININNIDSDEQPIPQLSQKSNNLNVILNFDVNPHRIYYQIITKDERSVTIQRQGENGWYNFINKYRIGQNQIVKYTIKLSKAKTNLIQIGFCSLQCLGIIFNFNHRQSVYYNCHHGTLKVGGISKCALLGKSEEGDQVECIANMPNNRLVWLKNGNKLYSCNIPPQIRKKGMYFSLLLAVSGYQVQVTAQ